MKPRKPRKGTVPARSRTPRSSNSPADSGVGSPTGDKSSSARLRAPSKTRSLAVRLAVAVLSPLIFFSGLELVLRLCGFGYPSQFFLPGRINGQKIVHDNQQFGRRFFPPAMARTPRPEVLSEIKEPKTCRIFVFGESAAFGDPSPAFGLPRVLEVLLRNRYPKVRFEVVNVAMTAINSNVILPIARDCAGEQGDVWVLYMGNNEVVGPYGGGTVFGPQVPSLAFIRTSIGVNASRIGQLLAELRESLFNRTTVGASNVRLELFLDQKLGHDDPRMAKVYAHFAQNLSDIIEIGIKSGAKVVVSSVAVNLKDCAPFASLHRPTLSEAQKLGWDRLYQAACQAEAAGKLSEALESYRAAAGIDDQWADLHFRQARALWDSGDFEGSLRHFILARDYDGLRFRADTSINDILRRTCSNRLKDGIAFVDGDQVLAQHSPHGIPGEELLYDHVHLNTTGNYWLARGIANQILNMRPRALGDQASATSDWLSEEECYAQLGLNDWDRYQTLDIVRQRLEGLPFTLQLNHTAQYQRLKKDIAECRSSLSRRSLTDGLVSCEKALSFSPNDWVLHQKLAQLLGQSPDKAGQSRAIEEWRQVIALVPHYPEVHYELGVLLDRTAQSLQAESELRLALKLKRNYYPDALNALGRVLAGENRLAGAIEKYEKAIQLKPNFADAIVNLGVALNRLGRKAEARVRFEEASRLAPGNEDAAVNLGQMLDENGEVSAAVVRYTEILRAEPDNISARYNLARCLALLGRSSEAQQHYAEALRLQPDFGEAHEQLAIELAKSGKQTEALEHFWQAVRLQPASPSAHKDLGIALARQQKFEEAAKQFEEALRLDPADATAQKLLQAARHSAGSGK